MIRIVDVGGANGALGSLIVDLAKQNNLKIEYHVIDPDSKIVNQARACFKDRIIFHTQSAGEFVEAMYTDQPEIVSLLKIKRVMIKTGQQKFWDLAKICDVLTDHYDHKKESFRDDELVKFLEVWQQDYANMPESFPFGDEKMIFDWISGQTEGYQYKSLYERWFEFQQSEIVKITKEIELAIAQLPSTFDLVINSWMPHELDFTADIRALNGAAILYATALDGSTGIQNNDSGGNVIHSRKPNKVLGEEESYGVGVNYRMQVGWVGPDLSYKEQYLLMNGFVLEVKKPYFKPYEFGDYSTAHFQLRDEYIWFSSKHIPPPRQIIPIPDFVVLREQGEYQNYRSDLNKQMSELTDSF